MQSGTLRFLRTAQNLKQQTIADLLGMSQANYSNLENGKTKLNQEVTAVLAHYYGISEDALSTDKHSVINHTIRTHSMGITVPPQQFETNEELLNPILERMEILLNILADEKEELATERKQLCEVFDKLVSKFGNILAGPAV